MPSYRASGTENLRAKQSTPSSKVAEGGTKSGSDVGGTGSPRANYSAPSPSLPAAPGKGTRSTQGKTYSDGRV